MVQPIHHTVKINKRLLSPNYPELKLAKHDIRNTAFKPAHTSQDRLQDHYTATLESDLLLINYTHNQQRQEGLKTREWDGSSPYHINRPVRPPRGRLVQTKDIKPRTWKNVPQLELIAINCFVKEAKAQSHLVIAAHLQLQQITNSKVQRVFTKSNVPQWGIRKGMPIGAKAEIFGADAHTFVTTLNELVLPRIRNFQGITNKSGDRSGNITFGLTPEDVKLFPELENNAEQWAKTFGIHITFRTTAQTDAEARILLSGLGFPFYGEEKN
ncbi:hypothetical protein BABINDRAFT_158886 [Babjeviella inositovora NRRL Y-12698]|uniref:Large ribosomal subunit protein uL5m n=1 Tax=Babjeviella inositovora NRRL Y-12698 TaxID=984486 RepID=A0A1E3QXB9_9ASCO|nr:uncharacterized protein BABINDRAFT_158886 [Babjeviella inositovora NRRL Y-12698]ODQ82251.1 hypothetical protein BABINDRAFT_158886 [Babjeviella inositovora NRRL Y-12698]